MSFRIALPCIKAGIAHRTTSLTSASRAAYRSSRHFASTTLPPPPQSSPSTFRQWAIRLAIAIAFPTTYLIGSAYPPQMIQILYPRHSPPPPEKDSTQGKAMIVEKERELQGLKVVEQLRGTKGWYESRPYDRFDPQKIHNSLTAGSLRGPGKLSIAPMLFAKEDESEAVGIVHLGRALCGHDGIIHGGLIATIFDETLARNAFLNLPSKMGVTASLTVDYKLPTMADQFVIVRTKLESVDGRKARVSGTMETLAGERMAEANGLFIEPRWAKLLQRSGATAALGRTLPSPNTPATMADKAEPVS